MTMLITVSSSVQPAPVRRHHLSPPPTLPKPGKDNLKLQRLLKKAAKKNALLAAEHAKAFRSSLSPVNEASPDLEHDEDPPQEETPEAKAPPSTGLFARLPIKPVPPRISSPFRRSKPFTLKVTEQRSIAEHVLLTTSSAMPLLQRPAAAEATQQPARLDAPLPSPHNPPVPLLPQPPPSSPPSNKQVPEVTYVTKAQAYLHSFKAPTSNRTQGPAGQEDRRPFSPAPEEPPGQIPTPLDDSKATAPALEPPVLAAAAEAEPPHQASRPAATEESIKPPSPKPSDTHTDKPVTHGSDAEVPAPEPAPQLTKQDEDSPNPPAPWRQAHPATAPPVQAGSTRGATSTGTKAEPDSQPQPTPSLPNASPPLQADPTPSAEAAKPAGAGGWHRLRKHLVVQSEAPSFPEPEPGKLSQEEGSKEKDDARAVVSQDCKLLKSKATRMWDAILYQITLGKEKKQQQAEEKKQRKEESLFLPRRLPILLHKPRFDARKLKELAAKPMTKISTVFEVSRFRPEGAEKHTKSFNRTASGWSVN